MRIGVPKEIKNREHRVAVTPEGVALLVGAGHKVVVESRAGIDSAFTDQAYRKAGAFVTDSADEIWRCELVIKVKEPLPDEYRHFRKGVILFTYLHLAAVPELARELMASGVCAIGYETVQLESGRLPLLAPMSQVAGKVAAQLGVQYLQKENGSPFQGTGRLLGGMGSLNAARVVILGAGNVGINAAETVACLGAEVLLLEANETRIHTLQQKTHKNIQVHHYTHKNLIGLLPTCDLLIGAALIPGKHAPMLLQRSDIALMKAGSVFVDVAIDQGGMSETSRPTSYEDPVYLEEGVIHCCLPNLPAAVPQTSTAALTHATLPYVRKIADMGLDAAVASDPSLKLGINIRDGNIVHEGVRSALAGQV
ncbi:L-alanine dehydrogenase [Mariprofundus ferrinatatus]|uniref:Alanine dehydrogenase n=1 Tax=Mariprofundus ferrinatatus TaxID=1921087 RepID=A0A2K8L6D1_9PROT|nr:alanine dehydrogenase [Mariprofundus ferrinatatus]ATX81819.1 L-alanine dehydrogenase [Mariprofundus ferrinatatus]